MEVRFGGFSMKIPVIIQNTYSGVVDISGVEIKTGDTVTGHWADFSPDKVNFKDGRFQYLGLTISSWSVDNFKLEVIHA